MDREQTMPPLSVMINTSFSVREWLQYYRNVWNRNLTARLIDMQSDVTAKAINPDMQVESDDHRGVPVKERLEYRKILVQDSLNLIASIDKLLALDDATLTAFYSADALKVAPDMLPKQPEASTTPVLSKYKVLNDSGIALKNGNTAPKDSIVELDPKDADTIRFVEGGFIALDGVPTPEAKI